jgi:hypothetical protein
LKDDGHRIAAYIAKTVPTTVGLKVAAMLTGMKSGFAAAINELVPIEQSIQGICNDDDKVPTIRYPYYLNFGRELWARKNAGIDGPGLVGFAIPLAAKYVSLGYDTVVITKIALDVFGIVIP